MQSAMLSKIVGLCLMISSMGLLVCINPSDNSGVQKESEKKLPAEKKQLHFQSAVYDSVIYPNTFFKSSAVSFPSISAVQFRQSGSAVQSNPGKAKQQSIY